MSNKYTYVRPYTREQLYDCYINQGMSQRKMARYFHTNVRKIRADMEQWGIRVRGKTPSPVQLISEEELRDCYINKEMTLKQIAEYFNSDIGRVRLAVRQANITMRIGAKEGSRLPSYPTFSLEMQKQLIECYTIQCLSIPDIAEQFDIPYSQVYRLLKRRLRRLREEATEEQSYGTSIPSGLKTIYTSYKRRANERSFPFDLTLERVGTSVCRERGSLMRAYTTEEVESIARQLQAVTVNGQRVFQAIVSKAVMAEYHVIYVDTGVGTETLEFRKKREEVPNES